MNVNISLGNGPINNPIGGGMLKSVQDRMQRKQECDDKVAFYENQIASLKDMKADSLEEIGRKLDMFHSYQDSIAAAKQEYNYSQQFRVLDEAREMGEKIHEAAEKMEPKTAEERREEMAKEALGGEEKGELSKALEELKDIAEEMTKEALEETAEETLEELSSKNGAMPDVPPEEAMQDISSDEEDIPAYRPVNYYV